MAAVTQMLLLAARVPVTTLINASGNTKIGTMTNGGGLAAAFDGTTSQTAAASAATVGASTAGYNNFVGIDWGAGNTKLITKVDLFASSNEALINGVGGSGVKLFGSTDNFAASNVELHNFQTILASAASSVLNIVPTLITTAYRYHRIAISGNGANGSSIACVRFYQDI